MKPSPKRYAASCEAPNPDHPKYIPAPAAPAQLPSRVDLRPKSWPVWTQGPLESCTAQAVAGAVELIEIRAKDACPMVPSRLFLYWHERYLANLVSENAPVKMSYAVNALYRFGTCPESEWPYDPTQLTAQPRPDAYAHARAHSYWYSALKPDLHTMKTCLAEGRPFTVVIGIFHNWPGYVQPPQSTPSPDVPKGYVPMPPADSSTSLYHALLVVGYDDAVTGTDRAKGAFIFRNSEGDTFGEGGYGLLPYEFATDERLANSLFTFGRVA